MTALGPGKPAPVQWGDVYPGGVSTLAMTSPGYRALAAPKPTNPEQLLATAANPSWLATAGAGTLLLAGIFLYLDRRIVK